MLVLIDAGCEYQGYAGDITRTFPVNGKFTPAQREIYDIVLESLETALKLELQRGFKRFKNDVINFALRGGELTVHREGTGNVARIALIFAACINQHQHSALHRK